MKLTEAGHAAQLSNPVGKALTLPPGHRLAFEITQLTGGQYQLAIVVTAPTRRNGVMKPIRTTIDKVVADDESQLWASLSSLAQDRLCDAADRVELKR